MNIRDVSVGRLKEYENNPRNNDLAVEKVKYSIERFGFMFPIVIDLNYVIVCGHTRVRACKELGIQTVPCIIADELTEEQINLFRLVDNKSSEYSDWDFEKLKEELSLVDLTLDENQLLLERFELTSEVFDIDAEQAEIKIPAFNFMGVNDKPREKKPTVRTIISSENDELEDENSEIDSAADDVLTYTEDAPLETTHQTVEAPTTTTATTVTSVSHQESASVQTEDAPQKKESKTSTQFCQFRFGDVSFFISQVELDGLNAKYTEYLDSGKALECSFAEFLLKGVENRD